MVESVWEYVVKEQARGRFELAYGPGGVWSDHFGGATGFRGTTVLRDTRDPRRYLVVDLWESEAQRERALAGCRAEHAALEAALAGWCESGAELGVFRVLAEATVRPRGRGGREARRDRRP